MHRLRRNHNVTARLCALRAAAVWSIAVSGISPLTAQTLTVNGAALTNHGLIGVGRLSANARDKFGETVGAFSGLTVDARTWKRNADGTYSGTLYAQPDRGYTKSGTTTNYRSRLHTFAITLAPATSSAASQTQLGLTLADTLLLTEPDGTPLTSLDPTVTGAGSRPGFPPLPQALNGRISLDAEGVALAADGSFFVSDEYGPYLYHFGSDGKLIAAIRPPEALVPKRSGRDSFSSDNAATGQPSPSPGEPVTGRENNRGFEGLTLSADGRTLYALLQSATRQDGASAGLAKRRHTRLLAYDISNATPVLKAEWVVPLPVYSDGSLSRVASAGECLVLNSRQFLILVRDRNGRGGNSATSLYRAVLLCDVSAATNIAGSAYDTPSTPVAPGGTLLAGIVPATTSLFIDINDATQLARFGLNNGPNETNNTLAQKWESLALVPALDPAAPGDFFLFIANDNDFSTTDGFHDGATFKANLNIDSMVLVYRLSLSTRLINISSRSQTGPGDAAHIVGFVAQGPLSRRFLVRGIGPALSAFGVGTALADPVVRVYDATARVVAENDNWQSNGNVVELRAATTAVGAFTLPEGSKDAALLVYLDPGAYTVQVTGVGDTAGISLAEVYEVP